MAIINPTQLPRITREYLDSLKVPGKNFPFEITYANRRKNFALIFSIERELTEAERNTAVDIQIDVAGIPTGQNIQNPIDRPMVHFSYYGKLNDLVQGGRSFEVNVTKCVNEEGNGTLFVAPYVGGKHKTIAVNLTGASTNGGAVIQLLNLATSLNFTRDLRYGNYGPIVEMGEARPHGSLILNSQSKSGWDSVVEPGKFAEWALSFPIGINWDDISNKINIGIIFNNNTKKFYSGLVDNSYNTINGRGGVAGISDVSAMVYDYEIYPTRSRGERAYDRSSPGRLNTRAVLDMEKLFKGTFNLNALTDEEIDDISHIKISFTLNNDKGTIHFHFYPQRHLSVWNTSIASDIRLSKRSLVFSSYYIRPTKLLEGPELINIPNIDSFADRNIRKMVRMYSVVDNNQIKIVTPRIDTGQFNGVPGVNVERAAFLKSNMPENFRGRVDLAKARFFDVVLEDGTILASEGTAPPAPTLFDEVNQVYFACTARGSSIIVLNCNDGTVVDHVEFLQPDEVSFIINGVPTKNTGLKGYTQSLSLKPNAKPQDIYNNQCTIRVTISKNGRSESKEIELYAADIGRFSGQAMFFAFFEWGAPPVKLNYRDFFHEHPYGRQPILFKVYEENSRTPISETTAKSFYIRSANPVMFYPIGRKPTADYWGMPTALAPDGSSSKIPNIAVINDKSVIEKLSDYSEIGTLFRTNYTTLLVLDKTKNRFEFKLYQYEKTIAKDIEYFIAKNYARPNMAQPTTRLSRMAVLFVDGETGIPTVIGSIKSDEMDNAQKAVVSYSHTEELDQYGRQMTDVQHMTYSNTFSMNADIAMSRNLRKIIAAGRRGKIAIAFYEPLNNGASERSYWDYKYVYWCRLRDDIVQHTQDSRFLITTGVDDIYIIPKMTDLQITGPGSFTNKLISGGIIYDAESMPSKYRFDHPRYESSSDQPLVASGRLLYDIHRNGDTTFNTSSKPSISHMFSRGGGFNYDNTTELLVVGINGFGLWEHSVEAIGVIGAGTLPSSPITPTPPPPNLTVSFPGVRYIQMNSYHHDVFENDNNGHLYTEVGFGSEWYERPEYTDEELQSLRDSVVISFEYNGRKYNARGIARDPQSVGTFIFKNDELWPLLGNDSSGTGRRFIVSWGDNQQEVKLYKDEHVFGLYSITPTYRYTDQVFKGRISDTALPLGGDYFETEKFGVNRDYTSYRDSVIGTRTDLIIGDAKGNALNYIKTISYYKNGAPANPPYGLVGFKYGQESKFSHPTMKQDVYIDGGINLDSYLPAVGEDFTTGLDNVNRDLSEWRYSGMQINMHNRISYSNESGEITPAFAREQHWPIVVFRGDMIRTPRDSDNLGAGFLYVIEDDLIVNNEDESSGILLSANNDSRKIIIVFRGRWVLNDRSEDFYKRISSIAREVFIINETSLANHYLISTRHQHALELFEHGVGAGSDDTNITTNPRYAVDTNNIAHFQIAKAQLTGVANRIYLSMELPDKLDKPKADERFYFATEDTFLRRENTFQIETSNQSDNPKATRFFGNINTTNRDGNNVFRGTETEDIMQSDFVSIGHNEGDRKLMLLPTDAKKVKMFHKYNKMDNNQYTIDNRLKVIRGNDNHVTHVRAENVLYIQYSNNGSEVTSGIFFKSIFQMNSDLPFEFDVTTPGMGKVRHTFAKNFQRKGYWYTFYKSDKKYHKHSLDLGRSFEIVVHQNNRSRTDTIAYMNDANGINRAEHGYGLSTVLLDEFKEITDIFEGPGYAVNSSNGVQWVHMTNVNVTAYTSENLGGGAVTNNPSPEPAQPVVPSQPPSPQPKPSEPSGEATIDIVSEYIHDRTGNGGVMTNIVGARKFISISKKDNLYGPYDNMVNESGDSTDLAVAQIVVKLPGNNTEYPITVDKKSRHYVGDYVRYYISGNLPEPLRRNPWDDPLQVEIITSVYRGARNGKRYEIIRSARGRLVSWNHST